GGGTGRLLRGGRRAGRRRGGTGGRPADHRADDQSSGRPARAGRSRRAGPDPSRGAIRGALEWRERQLSRNRDRHPRLIRTARIAHRASRGAHGVLEPSPRILDTRPRRAYSERAYDRASQTLDRDAPIDSYALFPGIEYRRHPDDLAESQGRHFARGIEGLGASGYRMVHRPLLTSG